MKYLITGANSFVGKHFCQHLTENQIDFTACVRSNPKGTQIATGDLSKFSDWSQLFKGIDVVVHTAGKAHDMSNSTELDITYKKINLDLTKKLAEEAKKAGVRRFVFISSIKVNGEFTRNQPFRPDDVPNPVGSYAVSKYLAELELLKLNELYKFEVVIVRPCLIYGVGVKANFENLIKLVKKGIPLPFANVENKRSFVSITNLNDLIVRCANSAKAAGQIYLVSDDHDLSLPELIQIIATALKIKITLLPIPTTVMRLTLKAIGKSDFANRLFSNLQVDITKTKEDLNWAPPQSPIDEFEKMLRL